MFLTKRKQQTQLSSKVKPEWMKIGKNSNIYIYWNWSYIEIDCKRKY